MTTNHSAEYYGAGTTNNYSDQHGHGTSHAGQSTTINHPVDVTITVLRAATDQTTNSGYHESSTHGQLHDSVRNRTAGGWTTAQSTTINQPTKVTIKLTPASSTTQWTAPAQSAMTTPADSWFTPSYEYKDDNKSWTTETYVYKEEPKSWSTPSYEYKDDKSWSTLLIRIQG